MTNLCPLRLSVLLLFLAPALRAEEAAPSTLPADELIEKTQAAMEELTGLESSTRADRDAFERSETDLGRAIAELKKPLPQRPVPLNDLDRADSEAAIDNIRAQIVLARDFHDAWEQRQNRYRRAAETLALLGTLSSDLRKTHRKLLDRIAALRPLLIEAQRRVDRRDLKLESFKLEEDTHTPAEWIAKSSILASQRDELLGEIDKMVSRLKTRRQAFEALPQEDPETARIAAYTEIALGTLAEATAVGDDQRARLTKAPAETIPTVVERAVEEWKARRNTLGLAEKKVHAQRQAFDTIVSERDALVIPTLQDVAASDELPEIRDARQDTELAARMIDFYRKSLELLEKTGVKRKGLLKAIEEASRQHNVFNRQCGRLWAVVQHAANLASGGDLPEWVEPSDASPQIIWNEWRHFQTSEIDRHELAERLHTEAADAKAIEALQEQLEKETDNRQRAKARLKTELSYAESVTRMGDESDEHLLSLLVPDGEIARTVAAIEAELARLRKEASAATHQCLEAVRTVQGVENPYTRAIMREHADRLDTLRSSLDALEEGKLPEDRSGSLPTVTDSPRVDFPPDLLDAAKITKMTAAELATRESEHVGREQQFTRLCLDYYVDLETSLDVLRTGLADRHSLDGEQEAKMEAWVQEEKRRYAAAREIRRRLDTGQLDAEKTPGELNKWLSRDAIHTALENQRGVQRDNSRFAERADYEAERLTKEVEGGHWMRTRSKAADARAALVGRPVALLDSALTPLKELDKVDRENLEYKARVAESADDSFVNIILERFTGDAEREHFAETRHTYHLELVNTLRVARDYEEALKAYQEISEICVQEKKDLDPAKAVFREAIAHRLFDYHAARCAAGIAVHPGARAQLETVFRSEYGRDLPYRLNFLEEDVNMAAELLFGAAARLAAARAFSEDATQFLSKVGLEQDIAWYQGQIARIGSQIDTQKSREEDLLEKIAGLRRSYGSSVRSNALRGFGFTLLIPVLAFLIVRILRRAARSFEKRTVHREAEDTSDRHRRMQTISNTTTATISVLVWTIAIVYVFAQLGLDVTPIVASASVLGLAVAFGAQALIKDFFYGFFILIENQFTIGDVVTLGSITGTVEKISLRITVLRDLEGVVHYIPNGTIIQVSNKTQGWSRVVMEVSVAYKEDPDYASTVLGDILLEMASDESWRRDIIEDPVVAGVQNLTERSVDIRVMIKTRPGKQWAIGREARRRIKKRFDELGIEIPFPHRVVHHVYQGDESARPERARSSVEGASDE